PGGGDVVAALGDQQPPFGGGRRGAVAEEAEGGDLQDRRAQLQRRERDHRGGGVGQDVAPQDRGQRAAGAERGLDVLAPTHLEHPGAGQAGEGRDRGDAHGDRRIGGAEAQQDHHRQRQQQPGDRQQHVDHAHQHVLDEPADAAGDHADRGADHEADGHGHERRGDRVGGAVDHAGEHVPPGRVGAEPVLGAGGLQGGADGGGGPVGGEQPRCQRPGDRQQQHQGGEHHGGAQRGQAPSAGPGGSGGRGLIAGEGLEAHHAVTSLCSVVEPDVPAPDAAGAASVRRSRASSTGYSRSTMRFTSTNTMVDSTTTAISTGVSRAATAWAVSWPTPILPNTASVTTAPPTSSPNSSPAIVRVGSRALRATVRHSSHQVEAPRARATATKGWAETSSIERISTCASGAAIGRASVATGRISDWAGLAFSTGTRPSRNENTWMSMIPIQNTGRDTISGGRPRSAPRSQVVARVPRRLPWVAVNAMVTASTTASSRPSAARVSVEGSASASRAETAAPLWTEYPRAPCRKETTVSRYCSTAGRSAPKAARISASCSGVSPRSGLP